MSDSRNSELCRTLNEAMALCHEIHEDASRILTHLQQISNPDCYVVPTTIDAASQTEISAVPTHAESHHLPEVAVLTTRHEILIREALIECDEIHNQVARIKTALELTVGSDPPVIPVRVETGSQTSITIRSGADDEDLYLILNSTYEA